MKVRGLLHVPAAHPQGKSSDGPQILSGRGGEEKNPSSAGNGTQLLQPVD